MSALFGSIFGNGDSAPVRLTVRLPQTEAIKLTETCVHLAEIAKKMIELAAHIEDVEIARAVLVHADNVLDSARQVSSAVDSILQVYPFSFAPDV